MGAFEVAGGSLIQWKGNEKKARRGKATKVG